MKRGISAILATVLLLMSGMSLADATPEPGDIQRENAVEMARAVLCGKFDVEGNISASTVEAVFGYSNDYDSEEPVWAVKFESDCTPEPPLYYGAYVVILSREGTLLYLRSPRLSTLRFCR